MTAVTDTSRALRLKAVTRATHDRLDGSIMGVASFETLAGYARFAGVQWLFHRDIAALYDDATLQAWLPGLAGRRRLDVITHDLADLGIEPVSGSSQVVFGAEDPVDGPCALGWLYVAEGSNMGAALLRKQAAKLGLSDDHGARHLAPAAEGPAAHWRRFTADLDAVVLDAEQDDRVMAGAEAAFARMQHYVDTCLG